MKKKKRKRSKRRSNEEEKGDGNFHGLEKFNPLSTNKNEEMKN